MNKVRLLYIYNKFKFMSFIIIIILFIHKLCKIYNVKHLSKVKQVTYTEILKRTKQVLDKLNIPFFLSSGTCLGYYRENKFIDHDYDIDIGIFEKDYNKDIIKEMISEGFIHYRTLGDKETGLELSFRLPNTELGKNAKIDIFLHYTDNDKYSWYSYIYPEFKKKIKYSVNKFLLKKVKFVGLNVNVPYPTLNYITEHYGKDWMIPKKPFTEYIYYKSPKSIVKT